MTKAKILPYINRFNGEVKTLTRSEGKKLSEDWSRARVVTNSEGKKVFRFEIEAPVKGPDGKVHNGIATVDLQEVEVEDGVGKPE